VDLQGDTAPPAPWLQGRVEAFKSTPLTRPQDLWRQQGEGERPRSSLKSNAGTTAPASSAPTGLTPSQQLRLTSYVPLKSVQNTVGGEAWSKGASFGQPDSLVRGGGQLVAGRAVAQGQASVYADPANLRLGAQASGLAEATGFEANGYLETNYGTAQGSVKVGEALATGNASVDFDPLKGRIGVQAGGDVEVDAVKAEGSVDTVFGQHLTGQGTIGADAGAVANATFDPLKGTVDAGVHADAFAGGKLSGSVSQDVGPATVGANGYVSYGVGANLDAELGMKDGKLNYGFDIGATLGVGGGIGFHGSLDVGKIAKDVEKVAAPVVKPLEEAAKTTAHAVKDAGEKVADGAKTAVNAVADGAKSAVKSIGHIFGL